MEQDVIKSAHSRCIAVLLGIKSALDSALSATPDQVISEALDYAIEISDQHVDDRDAVARAAERWGLEFDVLWNAWIKRFRK